MYQQYLTCAALGICTYTDVRYRRVYKKVTVAYLLLALMGRLAMKTMDGRQLVLGLAPGICCLAVSWVTRQGLGYGDSILIAVCGISLGAELCVRMIGIALFWAGVWALFLFRLKGANRKKEFPFVPFLLAGALLGGIL